MTGKANRSSDTRRVVVPPGSELDAALAEAEAEKCFVELVHGEHKYGLVPITGNFEDSERALRSILIARARAIRERQVPLGITTARLVREARGEHVDD